MSSLNRRWGGTYELGEMLEAMPGGTILATRDFALLTLAGQLSARFPGQLVFKGGFVLRHVHGHLRFSKDVDATRHQPAGHKLDGGEVAEAIRQASIRNVVAFIPDEPATDSARSLDFDLVRVEVEAFPATSVQVEVSYREAVVDEPVEAFIGEPFYEPFPILAMTVEEMAAEKLRALAKRLRATDLADLADLAVMLRDGPPSTTRTSGDWPRPSSLSSPPATPTEPAASKTTCRTWPAPTTTPSVRCSPRHPRIAKQRRSSGPESERGLGGGVGLRVLRVLREWSPDILCSRRRRPKRLPEEWVQPAPTLRVG